MSKSVAEFLSRQLLLDYAGSGSFERGEKYFNSGSVFGLEEYQGKVVAKVSGTHDYRVKLWIEDKDEIGYDCDCPFAGEGNFCKHCVAVGLACVAERKEDSKETSIGKKRATNLDDIKNYLQTREKSELIEMLMQEVLDNETLRGQLLLAVARSNPQGVDVKTYRKELKRIFKTDGHDYDDDYYGGFDNSDDVEQVVESIEGLAEDGHYEAVIDLCEYALKLASKALNYVHESDGAIEDAMENLQELHLSACEQAKPDAENVARRLFEYELDDDWGTFHNAANKYSDVLGKKGLTLYRRLIEKEWEKLPALKPGDDKSYGGNRYRITNMMESLASAEGDIEKLVEIKSRDLSSQYHYYQIAEIYRENKKYDKALEWAERGISDFPKAERIDWRLGEFLANEYHRRKRHDEAMRIIWKQFEKSPDLGNYDKLKEHADKVTPESAWQIWREKAFEFIRQDIAERKKNKSFGRSYHRADNSLLITIFLQENLPEEAWQEAEKGGCSEDLWLKLAKIREKEHPTDALKIYRERIEPKIQETNNQAYNQAVIWIKEVKRLMSQLGRESEFEDYLVALRVNYKIKRNFIKLLGFNKMVNENNENPIVSIIMGSTSDWETMKNAADILEGFVVPHETRVISAHRTPDLLFEFAKSAESRGIEVIIAGAGGAAHLPGMCASQTVLPVLGVPVQSKALSGMDSLLSIVQMPAGIPVGTLAIGNAGAKNAALLAISILANSRSELREKLKKFRAEQTQSVLESTFN